MLLQNQSADPYSRQQSPWSLLCVCVCVCVCVYSEFPWLLYSRVYDVCILAVKEINKIHSIIIYCNYLRAVVLYIV